MIISFDIQPAVDNCKTGVGYCAQGWIKGYLEQFPEDKCLLRCFANKNKSTIEESELLLYPNAMKDHCSWMKLWLCKLIWSFLPIPYQFFFRSKADVSFFF